MLLGRPSGGRAEFIGARQVSWLAAYRRRRLPGPTKAQWRKSVGTPLTVAGAATDRRQAPTVFPFHPRSRSRDRARVYVPASRGVVKWRSKRARFAAKPQNCAAHAQRLCRRGSEHREKTGPHFSRQLFEWFGARTSGSEPSPELPQRGDLGSCNDRVPGRDVVFRLRQTTILAKQRFGESTFHFMLQHGESVRGGRP
jgi:hypothetical protein